MKRIFVHIMAVLVLLFSFTVVVKNVVAQQESRINNISPTLVSYQGYVSVNGSAFNGTGYFKFAILDEAGTTSHWSNDGTSNTGDEPDAGLPLEVRNGLFAVLLGDTNAGMQALTAQVFDEPGRSLRVWFSSDGGASYTQLTPDRAITSVPYAYVAEEAGNADLLDGLDSLDFAATGHNHDAAYAALVHAHNDLYALISHDHDAEYSPLGHDHDAFYAALSHAHDDLYALISHDHDEAYVNENAFEVDNADIATGTLAINRLDPSTDGSGSGLDADLLDGQNSTYYQRQVSGTCPPGYAVLAVLSDGMVTCEPVEGRPVFSRTLLATDSGTYKGFYSSITIGVDGLGLISFYDGQNADLVVAHCENIACTEFTLNTLDSTGDVGQYTSLAIGKDGLGVISYHDVTNGSLKVAHCNDIPCTTATYQTVDYSTTNIRGWWTSININKDGFPWISYLDVTDNALRVASCVNSTCSTHSATQVDLLGSVFYNHGPSSTIGADGLGLISYYDATNSDLKVAHCDNTACSTFTTYTLDNVDNVGLAPAITIGMDGLGLISYRDETNGDLKVAHCDNLACSTATYATVDSTQQMGWFSSITIGEDGLPLIAYRASTIQSLKVAHCQDITCSSAILNVLDSGMDEGYYTSITIGTDGLALISYDSGWLKGLKIAHLSNVIGTPWVRRR